MNKIYAYTIQLGNNMWYDKESLPHEDPLHLHARIPYRSEFNKDIATFRLLVDHAKNEGFNTIIINMGEGYCYKSHPEIALCGAWTEDELKTEIAHIRELGMEPVPMLNFSAAHDMWLGKYERMVGTDTYKTVCLDLIDEVCKLFDSPKYFHIGMDEERYETQTYLDFATVRNRVVMSRDIKDFFAVIRKNGVTPWMFYDFYSVSREDFLDIVDKDVILSDMHLRYSVSQNVFPVEFPKLIADGYKIVPMVTHYFLLRFGDTLMNYLKSNIDKDSVAGIINFPFLFCEDDNKYKLMYEATKTMNIVKNNSDYFN